MADRLFPVTKYVRIHLSLVEGLLHYIVGALGICVGSFLGYFHSVTPVDSPKYDPLTPLYGIAFLAVGTFTTWWQWRALKFRMIRTARTAEENYAAVRAILKRERWRLVQATHAVSIRALTGPEWPRSYKRRVTVMFDGSNVYVNSIMNPARFWLPGVISFGGIADDEYAVASAVAPTNVNAQSRSS